MLKVERLLSGCTDTHTRADIASLTNGWRVQWRGGRCASVVTRWFVHRLRMRCLCRFESSVHKLCSSGRVKLVQYHRQRWGGKNVFLDAT